MNENPIHKITLDSTDIDEFSTMLKNVNVENELMERGPFKVSMSFVATPKVRLCHFKMNRKILQRGVGAPGFVTFLIWDDKFSLNWRKKILSENQLAVLWNQEHYSLSEAGIEGLPISVEENLLIQCLEIRGYPSMVSKLKNTDSLMVAEPLLQNLRLKISTLSRINDLEQKVLLNLIEEELVDELINCIISSSDHSEKFDFLPQKFSHAIDYIHNNLIDITSVRQVCQFNNISERTLRYHFEKKFNISPKNFIQRLRLNAVNKNISNVKEISNIYKIAAEYNFWHMGQFARDYKKLFGELPSDTLKHVQNV